MHDQLRAPAIRPTVRDCHRPFRRSRDHRSPQARLTRTLNLVLNGKAGTAMLAFDEQLDDAELAAVITYQRNAFGNETGDALQPADVAAARK